MNLLVINLDKAIFSENSLSLKRLKEYSGLVDKIFVIVWTKNKAEPIIYGDKLYIYPTNSSRRLLYFFDSLKIAKNILKSNKIDLLFTQDPFETGLAGYLISKIYKIKLQLQIHTDIFSPYFWLESFPNKLRVILGKFLIKRADSFRVVSRRIKERLISRLGVEEEKITVVPIYSDCPAHNAQRVMSDKEEFIFLTVGRLVAVKNIELQIKALAIVVKKFPKIKLWIIGDGARRKKLERLSRELGLERRVVFMGWQNNIKNYYGQADAFLLTSNYEGWGLAAIEAASFGLPIIMTEVGCAGEVIKGFASAALNGVRSNEAENNESGIVIPVGDKQKLAEAMLEIIVSENLRKKLGANAKLAVSRLPNKEETLKLYKESWEK